MSEFMLEQEWIKEGAHQSFVAWLSQRVKAAEARAAQAEAERDALRADMKQCVADARKMAADLYRAQNERDEARRQLAEMRG